MKKEKLTTTKDLLKKLKFTKAEIKEVKNEANYIVALMNLREQRKKMRYTQEMLAEKSGVPRPTISKIESGNRNTTISTLMKVAEAMGKTLEITFK